MLYLLTGNTRALRIVGKNPLWTIIGMREWLGHGALTCMKYEPIDEGVQPMKDNHPTDVAATDMQIDTAWTPKEATDLPEDFATVLHAVLSEVADPDELARVEDEILALYDAKAKVYQDAKGVDSCFHRGLHGLFHNIMRKSDRIETVGIRLGVSGGEAVAAEAAADKEDPETLRKTIRDLVVYGIHTIRWLDAEAQVKRGIRIRP